MRIVGIRFKKAGRIYDFDAGVLELAFNDDVIIEVEKGIGLGKVARMPKDSSGESEAAPSRPEGRKLKRVVRKADQVDLERKVFNKNREEEAFKVCAEKVKEYKLPMKLVNVEYLFDSSKAIFYFTSESRVDFRVLVKDMAAHLFTRIEMRQIGVRDEAKLLGGFGPCGRELCCAGFLDEFKPVTVRMAKEQGLALNPLKISGVCGRLMCCLSYEHDGKNTKKRPKKSDTRRPDTQRGDGQRPDTQRTDNKQSGGRCCATKAEAGKEAGGGDSCACPSKARPRHGGDRDRNKKDDRSKDDRGRQGRDRNRSDRSARSKEEAPKKAPLKGDIHLEGVVPDASTESGDKKPQGEARKGGPAGARPGSSGSPASPASKKRRGRRRGRRGGAGKKRTEGQGGTPPSGGNKPSSEGGSGSSSNSGSGGGSSSGSGSTSGGSTPPSGGGS